MRAVWPGPWLEVRDAVRSMRARDTYITIERFWALCAEKGVSVEKAQRDLANQLDSLGEIVFYPDEPLSRFVVLDPTWLTELVARVVRDKHIRDEGGKLRASRSGTYLGAIPHSTPSGTT